MNMNLFKQLIAVYNRNAYTHRYIFGFTYKGNVYAVKATAEVLPYILKLDKASRGAGEALRFKPTNEQKILLLSMGADLICSKAFFENTYSGCKYNRGEVFEKLVTEKAGQEWKKDNVSFTVGPDLATKEGDFQIKFEKATFLNEKQAAGLN